MLPQLFSLESPFGRILEIVGEHTGSENRLQAKALILIDLQNVQRINLNMLFILNTC